MEEKKNFTEIQTQGEFKMMRYIEDLARNEHFKRKIKRLNKFTKKGKSKTDKVFTFSEEESAQIDKFGEEIYSILDSYKELAKRYKKLLYDRKFRAERRIAEEYFIDNWGIFYSIYCLQKNEETLRLLKSLFELDMCKICDLQDEENNPVYSKDDIISLNPTRTLRRIAYPVSISINPRASKRDVLDFVEKKWPFIESILSSYSEKKLKFGKRKFDQKLLDFIWDNRALKPAEIKNALDIKFPSSDLVYYEISRIIRQEREKRLRELT